MFCPFQYFLEHEHEHNGVGSYSCKGDKLTLRDEFGSDLLFILPESCHIPYMNLSDNVPETGFTNEMAYKMTIVRDDVKLQHYLSEINHNLSKPQKEVKLWHCRMCHAGFTRIQDLMRTKKENVGDPSQPPVPTVTHPTTRAVPHLSVQLASLPNNIEEHLFPIPSRPNQNRKWQFNGMP